MQKVDWSLPHTKVHVRTNLVQLVPLYHRLQNLRPLHADLVHRVKPQHKGSWLLPEQRTATAKLCLDNAAVPGYIIFLCDDVLKKYLSPILYHLLVGVSIKLTSNALLSLLLFCLFWVIKPPNWLLDPSGLYNLNIHWSLHKDTCTDCTLLKCLFGFQLSF